MNYCKRNHPIRSSQDRLPNRTCRECNRLAAREYQRRTRADAAKYRQLQELLQIA